MKEKIPLRGIFYFFFEHKVTKYHEVHKANSGKSLWFEDNFDYRKPTLCSLFLNCLCVSKKNPAQRESLFYLLFSFDLLAKKIPRSGNPLFYLLFSFDLLAKKIPRRGNISFTS
jgi:hypothetical protein